MTANEPPRDIDQGLLELFAHERMMDIHLRVEHFLASDWLAKVKAEAEVGKLMEMHERADESVVSERDVEDVRDWLDSEITRIRRDAGLGGDGS